MSRLGGCEFDVAVIGAGPAGATAARHLARAGFRTLLAGGAAGQSERIGETLPPSATPLLERLGLWPSFRATEPLACYGNRSSWGADGQLTDYDFIRDRNGPGWHIDRPRFDMMLCDAAESAGACRLDGVTLGSVERLGGSWRLRLNGFDGEIEARLAVDASGRAAAFARRIGVRRVRVDAQVAAVAFLQPQGKPAADSTTLIEATREGWWYSAVLPSGALAAAFVTAPGQLAERRLWTAPGWQALLDESEHTRRRTEASGYHLVRPPRIADASTTRLQCASGDGWLAAGDAAAAHDPLSSDGIGCALAGSVAAAKALAEQAGGSERALAAYSDQIARSFSRYLALRRAYYAEEDRWPDAPFWRERNGRLPHATTARAGLSEMATR